MQLQLGNFKLAYKEQPAFINELIKSATLADSALYIHYNMPYYNPNKLYEKKGGYDLFDDMREDDQISAVLNLMKYIILGAEWDIDTDHEEAKEFITDNFNNLDEIFIKKLYNILSAMDYGFSLTELIFKQEDGKILLNKLKTRMPHNFNFTLDDYGNITKVVQNVKGQDISLNLDKFLYFAYQAEFDNPYGKSAMNQGVYRAYWSKNAIIKFWNIYLERHGMPFGVGTYPKGTGTGAIDDLKNIGKNIQAKTFAVFPEGFDIDFKEASKGTDNYERAIDKYNMMIARAMLIPDLLGLSGAGTEGGSYALGEKQFDMFYTIVDFNQQQIQRLVTQKIVQPLIFYNFGADIEANFKFNVIDIQKKEKMLSLWLNAVNGGKIPITDTHVNWFLQNVDAPEIEQKELDEINAKKEEIANAIQSGKNQKEQPGKEQDKEKEKPKEQKEMTYSQYDKKINYAQIENDMNSIEDTYREDLRYYYKLSVNGLVDEIKRRQIIEKKRFDLIPNLQLKHQTKIQKLIRDMLKKAYSSGQGSVKTYIIDDTLVLNDAEIASWIDAYAYEYSTAETNRILGKVKPAISEGIKSGAGVKDIMKMINESLKGYDTTYEAPQIEAIIRTVTSTGFNQGRLQQFGSIQNQIQAYEFSAVMDKRTSEICESLNGTRLRPIEAKDYNPPKHHNCRSLLIPIFNNEKFDGNFNRPEIKMTKGSFAELA